MASDPSPEDPSPEDPSLEDPSLEDPSFAERLEGRVLALRARRGPSLAVALARIFLAFAFVPAGLKKVLGEPFTDPGKTGAFHAFLHAFHATGPFYGFVGAVQLSAAGLLLSQRYATLGSALYAPVLTTILVFCWSTRVIPTATVVTIMWLTTLGLLAWDLPRWRRAFSARALPPVREPAPPLSQRLWAGCGFFVTGLYLGACALEGGVYRPRGAEWSKPAFYVFFVMLLAVGACLVYESVYESRARRAQAA